MYNEYVFIILVVATCIMLFISYYCFRKRQLSVAKYCALVMLSSSFYSLGYAFEIISTDLESVKFWLKVEYIGIPFISTLWLILVIHFIGYQSILKKWVVILLFTIPVITFLMHWTNDVHHIYYLDIRMDISNAFQVKAILDKGTWYWVHIAYTYIQVAIGMILFVIMYLKSIPIVRKHILILMLGAAAPWFSNIIYLFGWTEMELDLTPLGFTLSGLFYLWGIFQFNMLRLAPIAFQKVFETMEDGVIILDYYNNIMNVNRAAKGMFDELHSFNGPASNVFSDYPELLEMMEETGNKVGRIKITRKENILHYDLKISILYDNSQTKLGKLVIFHDITQLISNQEKIISDAKQLAEFSTFKDRLFTVVAHDIRDPLAMLVNLTELLKEELKEAKSGELEIFQELSGQVKNTYSLVEHLLDWFRSQKGKVMFNPSKLDVASILDKAVHFAKIRGDRKNIEITYYIDGKIQAFADKEMLDLVLRNLLSNAVKYTDSYGYIRVGAVTDGEWVNVSVQDSGMGVDEETAKSLFHELHKNSNLGTEGETGSGLGLYLSEKFVSIHGGRIWFESIRGKGSTFFFTIPDNGGARCSQEKRRNTG